MPQRCAAATAAGHQCTRHVWWEGTLCRQHNYPNVHLFGGQNDRIFCIECRMRAIPGGDRCRRHEQLRPRPDLPPELRCLHRHCMRAAVEHQRCVRHVANFMRDRQRMLWDDMYIPAFLVLTEQPNDWRAVVAIWRERVGEPGITHAFVDHLEINISRHIRIPELWNHHMGDHAPMDEQGNIAWVTARRETRNPPRGELEAFVRDGQNVHTVHVTKQTNSALRILLDVDVPSDQRTIMETHLAFMNHIACDRINTTLDVVNSVDRDSKRWYRTVTCRMDGDYLYKRVLDGLWAKIKTSPLRSELEIRLWQEMVDSLGMCCDGHITRLANVLCGYDDAFQPELTPAEKLQNRMGVIASMDCGIIMQTAHAVAILRELEVPRELWSAWVDAL